MEQDQSPQQETSAATQPSPQTTQSGGPASVTRENWAPIGDRILATLIDGVLSVILAIIPVLIVSATLTMMLPAGFLLGTLYTYIQGIIAAAIVLGAFWFWNKDSLPATGQTVGKKILGLRIVRSDGYLADGNDLFIKRYGFFIVAPSLIPVVGFLLSLANLVFLFLEPQKPLHDRFANTRVVKAGGTTAWTDAHPIFTKLFGKGSQPNSAPPPQGS